MADDSGRSYLKQLAKNRLKGSASYSTSMKKKNFSHTKRRFANENTIPDTPPKGPLNAGNRQTGANMKMSREGVGPMHPKTMHRHSELPKNGNKFRRIR